MSIYRIEPKLNVYGWFELDMDKVLEGLGRKNYRRFKKSGESIIEQWKDFGARFEAPDGEVDSGERPDITTWGVSSFLVLNERAYELLRDLLSPYGEFLSAPCEGVEYRIFNCLAKMPVDESKSEKRINMGLQEGLDRLEFDREVVGETPVFKTDYDLFLSLFCSDKFKSIVEKNGLTGINIKEDLAGSLYLD